MKLSFRNAVGRPFEWVVFWKSLLTFPVDLSFLGLSFAAISMTRVQEVSKNALSAKVALSIFVACVVGIVIQHILSRAAEKKFDDAQYVFMGILGFLGYVLAIFVLVGTLNIRGVVS